MDTIKYPSEVTRSIIFLWNDEIEAAFDKVKKIVSIETVLNYTYWGIILTVRTDYYDRYFGDVIGKNNKPI